VGRTIACANQKGGVGKTTTVVNLASLMGLAGHRILIVDLDPQGNATSGLGIDRSRLEQSTYDGIIDGADITRLIVRAGSDPVDVVPSAIALAGAEVELAGSQGRERRLRSLLEPVVDAYDLIFVDCPPSLGLLTVNALTAADAVLIPLQCEYYALEGLTQLLATVDLVRDHLNPRLAIDGVVLTMADARTNLSAEVELEARRHLDGAVYETVIPRSVRLSEAPSHGRSILGYAPGSRGGMAYAALADEFRRRDAHRRADAYVASRSLAGAGAGMPS
jgi:chromosome partitioning protein